MSGYESIMIGDGERGELVVRHEINHDALAVARARRVLIELLRDWDDLTAADVLLATNELVTNVVRHTENGGELRVWDPGPGTPLRVEVEDADPTIPAVAAQPLGEGGRGLGIVQAVASGWGVDPLPAGKVVWAEFGRTALVDDATPHRSGE